MDVEDVSYIKQFVDILNKQKATLQAVSKRKGERPRDRKSRAQLVTGQMAHGLSAKMKDMRVDTNMVHPLVHQSWLPPPYPPSIAPLKELRQFFIKDLQLETHHRGFYALLRAVTPPNRMTALISIVEDEQNDVTTLQLYQQEDEAIRPAHEIIAQNAICIIKEPYFKVMNDGGYGLRVDHVSDINFLSEEDERIPLDWRPRFTPVNRTAKQWKEDGNAALKAGKLNKAIQCYNTALNCSTTDEDSQTVKLNRSLVHLKLQKFDKALEDADSQRSQKGLYRAARSLYELGRFRESQGVLKSLLAEHPDCDAAKKELVRTNDRLREQEHGHYDLQGMHKASYMTPPLLDTATYMGPLEVGISESRGRGLFTTRDVAAGELLLCEKAFSYCFADQSSSKTSLLMNTHTDRMVMGVQPDLITTTVQQLFRNPSFIPAVTSLYHGSYEAVKETAVDGIPIVDTFLIDRIISLNTFGSPRSSLDSHFNCRTPEEAQREQRYHSCGLYIYASYINHSCYCNARRSFIGNVQIVRATRNIPRGTEVFFWYTNPVHDHNYEKTQAGLQNWGFKCTCQMCTYEKNVPKNESKKRAALLGDLKLAFEPASTTKPDLPKAERLLAAIEQTYTTPATEVPRLALWDHYLRLTRSYASQNQAEKTILNAWKVLTTLGFVIKRRSSALSSPFEVEQWGLMVDALIEVWIHLWTAYARVAPELCVKAAQCAKLAHKVCIGWDETFGKRCGTGAREAMVG